MLRIAKKFSKILLGLCPRPQPRYFIPQSHSTLTHVPSPSHIYCLSSLKCSILTTLKIKHPTRKCFNLLKILKHNSQKFRWGFAPDTILDITVLSHTVLWSSVVYCSSISSFEGLILMSIKKSSILQKKCPKMLWILRQRSQKFCWGFAPESIQNRTVLSLLILVKQP